MAAPSIGGSALNSALYKGKYGVGHYHFTYQDERVSISGCIVKIGQQKVEWVWPYMDATNYNTLMTMYLAHPGSYELWTNDSRSASVSFTDGTLLRPTYEGSSASYFTNVKLQIVALQPLQA
jgi:hypothetical protein